MLTAQQAKGRKAFSFEYDRNWISSKAQLVLDPDIAWFKGAQFPNGKENFGVFMDSMPDTWGKRLMEKKAAQLARDAGKPMPTLYDIDYLLSVYDESRMGALRFKLDPDGPFLDDNKEHPTPHLSNLRELQNAAHILESDDPGKDSAKWIDILVARVHHLVEQGLKRIYWMTMVIPRSQNFLQKMILLIRRPGNTSCTGLQ